jgi:hypothetical protein
VFILTHFLFSHVAFRSRQKHLISSELSVLTPPYTTTFTIKCSLTSLEYNIIHLTLIRISEKKNYLSFSPMPVFFFFRKKRKPRTPVIAIIITTIIHVQYAMPKNASSPASTTKLILT